MIHKILSQRFNNTNKLIYLATSINNIPYIRAMTPYYHNHCFYFISDASSDKIKQIIEHPYVALCGEWFNAHGYAYNEGMLIDHPLFDDIKHYCASWIQLGKIDLHDPHTIVLKVELSDGYVIDRNEKYLIK